MRQSLQNTEFNHLNNSDINAASAQAMSTRDMGSTLVPNADKKSLAGMYLTADAQGVDGINVSQALESAAA